MFDIQNMTVASGHTEHAVQELLDKK